MRDQRPQQAMLGQHHPQEMGDQRPQQVMLGQHHPLEMQDQHSQGVSKTLQLDQPLSKEIHQLIGQFQHVQLQGQLVNKVESLPIDQCHNVQLPIRIQQDNRHL
jgi:hypothetical protein